MNGLRHHYFCVVILSICSIFRVEAFTGIERDNKLYTLLERQVNLLSSNHKYTCKEDHDFAWCKPQDYNRNIEPWKYRHLTNFTMPWYYYFEYYILDVQRVDDEEQTITVDMYLKKNCKWQESEL